MKVMHKLSGYYSLRGRYLKPPFIQGSAIDSEVTCKICLAGGMSKFKEGQKYKTKKTMSWGDHDDELIRKKLGVEQRVKEASVSAVDHEKRNKITAAYQINIYKYGDEMVSILSQRQKIAGRLLERGIDEIEANQLEILFEYYNAKIKLILGL